MSQEPFSLEEIQFIAAERVRALGPLRNTPEDRRRIVETIAEGFRIARRSGMIRMNLIIAARVKMRDGGPELQLWSGPSYAPDRPRWAHFGQEGVSIVQA